MVAQEFLHDACFAHAGGAVNPSRACDGGVGNRPVRPGARECAWREDTGSSAADGSSPCALHCSIERCLAERSGAARGRNSLAFPDFDREGGEVVGLLARPFRGFWAGSLDLRGNPFLAAPLWGAAGGGLFHDASRLEDVGKESALSRTGTSRLAQWFPGIQPFP